MCLVAWHWTCSMIKISFIKCRRHIWVQKSNCDWTSDTYSLTIVKVELLEREVQRISANTFVSMCSNGFIMLTISQFKSADNISPRSLWESWCGMFMSDIVYEVSNLHLNDKWTNFLRLKSKSESLDQVNIVQWYPCVGHCGQIEYWYEENTL